MIEEEMNSGGTAVAEKKEYGGVQRVADETGYRVKTLVQISISGERSKVIRTR